MEVVSSQRVALRCVGILSVVMGGKLGINCMCANALTSKITEIFLPIPLYT